MTVNFEVPYLEYTANGTTTVFPFQWSSGDANDNYVEIDGILATEGVEYELEDWQEHFGGNIVFTEPPVSGTQILIYRKTPITQQVSYEEGEPFPAEIHERQLDKDTRILQEIDAAGRGGTGIVNLSADQQPEYFDIVNDSGSNARIVPWDDEGAFSGAFVGEVIPDGGTPPEDTAPTTKVDGYVWWVMGAPASAGGDPQITMLTSAILVSSDELFPIPSRAELDFDASQRQLGWGYDKTTPLVEPVWTTEYIFKDIVSVPGTYLYRLRLVSGITPNGSAVDIWFDATADGNWYVDSNNAGTFYGILDLAPDAGGGTPDETKMVSRYITLEAL